jgi:hypothetical protein
MPDTGGGPHVPPRLVVLAGRKGRPSLLPFVGVLLALLAVGLVGLLMLNTALNKGAFSLRQENRKSTALTQEDQQYQQELAKLSEPGALATKAQQLGMVPNGNPAFLDPGSGAVLGSPRAAPTLTAAPPTTPPGVGGALLPNTPTATPTPTATSAGIAPSETAPGGAAPTTTAPATPPTTPKPSGPPTATGR